MASDLFFYLLIAFLISAFITRLIFSIPLITKHLKAQTRLLSRIALKNGVPPEDVADIISEVNTSSAAERNHDVRS